MDMENRSYLWGCLWAIANHRARESGQCNLSYEWRNFSSSPHRVWDKVERTLVLHWTAEDKRMIAEIMSHFDTAEFKHPRPLKGLYCYGYHCYNRENNWC